MTSDLTSHKCIRGLLTYLSYTYNVHILYFTMQSHNLGMSKYFQHTGYFNKAPTVIALMKLNMHGNYKRTVIYKNIRSWT